MAGYALGAEIKADIFEAGEIVDVVGVTKGKGFAGGMKRHNFKGSRRSARNPAEAPFARIDRGLCDAGPCLQGHEDGRSHGSRRGSRP